METKKSIKAELECKRAIMFQTGLIIVMTLVLFAFEWKKSYNSNDGEFIWDNSAELDEIVMNTIREEMPAPKRIFNPVMIFEITDDEFIDDDYDIFLPEDNPAHVLDYYIFTLPDDKEVDDGMMRKFTIVEKMPEFPGGEEARVKFLIENLKYPELAKETGIEGTVYIEFIVEKDGSLTNFSVKNGIGGGCDEEAMRVAKLMPNWTPGKQREKPVRVILVMPVNFKLMSK